MVMRGVIATRATIPNPSRNGFPPIACDIPSEKASKNELDNGPDATPPESNAIAVNKGGEKNERDSAIMYPGIRIKVRGIEYTILIIARATAKETPREKKMSMIFFEIVPLETSLTCSVNTHTAGSARTITAPKMNPIGMRTKEGVNVPKEAPRALPIGIRAPLTPTKNIINPIDV